MGVLYALSPTAYHALGYVFVGAVALIVSWVFFQLFSSHKQWIVDSFMQQRRIGANLHVEEAAAAATKPWKVAIPLASFQTGLFCLYGWLLIYRKEGSFLYALLITNLGVWPQLCLSSRYPNKLSQKDSDTRLMLTIFGFLAAVTGCLLFSSLAFRCWNQWEPLAVYDYHGQVFVINNQDSYIGQDGRNNRLPKLSRYYFGCPVDEAVGHIQTMWICPASGKVCQSWMHSYHCDFTVCEGCDGVGCTQQEYTQALQDSQSCVQSNSSFPSFFSLTNQQLLAGVSPPSSKEDLEHNAWSNFTMYMDCNSCTAEWEDIVDEISADKISGGYLPVVPFSIIFALCLLGYVVFYRKRQKSMSLHNINDEHSQLEIEPITRETS